MSTHDDRPWHVWPAHRDCLRNSGLPSVSVRSDLGYDPHVIILPKLPQVGLRTPRTVMPFLILC